MAAVSAKTEKRAGRLGSPAKASFSRSDAIKSFVENAPLAVAMTDRRLRFLKVSPTWLADFGLSEAQLIGRCSYDLAPETRDRYVHLHQRCLAGETLSSEPERIVTPNGGIRWMKWNAGPWRDGSGRIGGLLITSHDVSAQMQAQDDARHSRAFAAMILEHSPLPLVVKDHTGCVLMMNRAMQELYSVSAKDHIGRTMHELLPAEVAQRLAEEDRVALESGEPIVFEERLSLAGQDEPRILRKTKVAIRDDRGAAFLLSISEDVTETRNTQDELERTRAFLETVIDSLPAGLTVKEAASGRLMIANQAAAALYGVSAPGENFGLTHEDVFPAELAARFSAHDREVIETGESRLFEEEPVPTAAGMRYLNQRKALIRNDQGPDYLLSISEDVTERRMAAEELRRTRAFLETVIASVPAGITVKDASSGRLLVINPAVEMIYGVGPGDNIGKTGDEVFPHDQAERFARQDREVIESGEMRTYEEDPVWTARGVRFLNRRKVLIRNEAGSDYLLSISEDVTERKVAQDDLKDAVARAEAASVAKSEFLANMSHEIRTPLNGVLGLADALSRMDLTARQAEVVKMIVSSGKALTGILSDVLDLAKAEAGQLQLNPEPFGLRETIGAAAFLFEAVAIGKGIGFRVDFEPDSPDRLIGDALRIKQVVSNLISNAVKFTSEGEVAVKVSAREDGQGWARFSVTVTDTGPGFSEEVRARLFSRFEQGDGSITRRYGGTGLGLSIAGALVQMMDGEIDCCATPGEGAAFTLSARLRIDETAAAALPSEGEAPLVLASRLKVLLAEDHEVNQQVVLLMLGDAADLTIVDNGADALDAALGAESFDVVLMDTQMPVMDGLTAIRRIREGEARLGRARTPIVSLTANAMAHQVQASIEAGADGHLAKPITASGLYAAIERAMEVASAEDRVSAA